MSKVQRITVTVSIIVILALAVLLGIFLWKEYREAARSSAAEPKQPELSGETVSGDGSSGAQKEEEQTDVSQIENLPEEEPEGYWEEQEMLAAQEIQMVFTGDVMFGGLVRSNYDASGINGILSQQLQSEMVQADITVINEEFPFSARGTAMEDKQYTFRVEPSYVAALQEMGADVVSLANNHALDYGTDALLDTFQVLDEAGIAYVGAGETKERAAQPAYVQCGDKTVGVLAASRVIPEVSWNIDNRQPGLFCTYDSTALVAAIQEAREQCDYLIVYVHWGVERQEHPEEYQRSLGQAYIDAGADLVVGSHPHVPQGIEYYQGKPIVYSLGNFIFNPNMVSTYMLKVIWETAGEARLCVIPIAAANALTSELEGQAAEEMLDYIESISYGITIDSQGIVAAQ